MGVLSASESMRGETNAAPSLWPQSVGAQRRIVRAGTHTQATTSMSTKTDDGCVKSVDALPGALPKPYYESDGIVIYNCDCREILHSLKADVTIADPPYNVGMDYSGGDARGDYPEWTASWVRTAPRPLVVTPGHANLAMWLAMERPRWTCAWVKPNQNSASALNGWNVWEPVLVYGKHRKPVGQDAWVIPIALQSDTGNHPCPKPLPFWKALVVSFSLDTDTILDPFMGSGTTLVAAKLEGRKAVGIEIEERYCEISAKRLAQGVLPFTAAHEESEVKA
jgi:site-specific DNA-methyltransferase (adenine-specific)